MAKVNISNSQIVTTEMRNSPYYNDWDEDKNYHAMVFRPEFAVQARELSQLGSILQNQIERFGQHMFVNGTPVLGGGIDFAAVTTLNLASTYNGVDIDVNDFANTRVQYSSNTNVLGEVWGVSDANANEPPNIHLRYTTAEDFGPGDTIKVAGQSVYANVISSANAVSNGFAAFIYDSVYFVDGYFIKVPKQTIIVEKYRYAGANVKIGLEKNKTIVTENDDSSLLDPAAESSNFDAPGAHRFKFELNLTTRTLESDDLEEFIELARFEDGVLVNKVENTKYAELEEMLARRTYDESGNYTVRPFIGDVREKDADEVYFTLSPGKAYINGYEYETIADTRLTVPKARVKANTVENYDLNMNYGNYVIVDNVAGTFDGTTMELVDMHCVPGHLIDFSGSTVYSKTKIGTARVVDMNFYGGDANTILRKHELYLTDTRFTSLSSNLASSASLSQVTFQSGQVSPQHHAYVNNTIRLISGPGAGYVGLITSYNGTSRIATVNPPFQTQPTNATNYRIEFAFQDVESFTKHTSYTSGATSNSNCNITLLNKRYRFGQEGIDYGAPVIISEPSLNKLIFPYPNEFIANNIVTDSYLYRRKYSGVQFTDGVSAAITAGATEDFEGATASSGIASTVMDNFLIFCENSQGSTRANGEQISASVTISGSPEQATFNTALGTADTFTATIFAKMENTGAGAVPRVKTLVLANTKIFARQGSANASILSSYNSNTHVFLNDGQVLISNPSKSTTVKQSLYISDVQSIVKIYNLNGATLSGGANLQSFADVTSYYSFDNGQRASYYDHASITLKPGYNAPKGALLVCTRYYKSGGDTGYFNVDSYPSLDEDITEETVNIGTGYALIPTFENIPLRDAIDFRPVRLNASGTTPNFSLVGIKTPIPATDLQSSYSYYLGRKDLIVAMPNRQIELIQGEPDLNPKFPPVPATGMILYRLTVPPYTLSYSNVIAQYVENKRYTMRDIGLIDTRLKNVEYYVSLSLLEKSAFDLNITDQNGLPRTKYGILAENFTGHELGASDRDDYVISVDLQGKIYNGRAVPTTNIESSQLQPISYTNVKLTGGQKATLTYNVAFGMGQHAPTKTTDPQVVGDLTGYIRTIPEADVYYTPKVYEVKPPVGNPLPPGGKPPGGGDGGGDGGGGGGGGGGLWDSVPRNSITPISEPTVGPEIGTGDTDPTEPTEALPPSPYTNPVGKPSAAIPVIQPIRGQIASDPNG